MPATDLEKLVVSLSADFKSYENAMAKASGITRKELASIKAGADGAGGASVVAFTGASRGVRTYGNAASVAAKQSGALRAQTGNLAAQFQDIAVQLQSGQSPFTIALQQGTQISAVLGGQGAGGAVKALGGAFLGLLSPVSLATIAIIAAGGFAVQYFSSLLDDGEKSAEELKKQSSLIQQVAKDWGDAIPQLAAYADQLDRAAKLAELKDVGAALIASTLEDAKEQATSLAASILDVENQLIVLGADATKIVDLTTAFNDFKNKVDEGTATAQDAEQVQAILLDLIGTGIPIVAQFAAEFDNLAGSLVNASTAASKAKSALATATDAMLTFKAAEKASMEELAIQQALGESFTKEQERRNSLTADQLALENQIADVKKGATDAGVIIDPATAKRLAEQTLAAEKSRSEAAKAGRGGGGAGKAATDAEREREAVTKLIEALQFENSLIGLSAVEKEKANALRRAGAAATVDERAQIEALVAAGYAETAALKATEDGMRNLKAVSKDVLGGIFDDLRDGADMAEVLANAISRVAESFVKAGIDTAIEGAFSSGFNPFGNLFGGNQLGPGYTPGRLYHQGGIVGSPGPTRVVPSALFANAPRYHGGGVAGMRPGEVPAILQRGERVLPRGDRGGGDVTVQVINAPAGTKVQESRGADGGRMIKVMIKQAVEGLMSEGSLDRSMATNFGVRRRAG